MTTNYAFLSPDSWDDYELIDCGGYEKLEKFGEFILSRPEPQAIWDKKLNEKQWDDLWHAKYLREKGRNDLILNSEKGNWIKKSEMKDKWTMSYKSQSMKLKLNLSLTSFGHIGIFPEQAGNWEYISQVINKLKAAEGDENQIKVLNLFAYTGASSLAACAAGAEVVHVDSVKQVVNWANENKTASKLEGVIRWVVEDAMKFVTREVRRGNLYHGIILDPPAYGRGPQGEKWLLDKNLNELLRLSSSLLLPKKSFLLLNTYAVGFSPIVMDTLVRQHFENKKIEIGELLLQSKSGKRLALSSFVRFNN